MKIFSSMIAAMGKQLKQSVNVFHSLMLYRRLPATQHVSGPLVGSRLTLVVEAVNSVNTSTLVVSSEDEEVFRVLDLVREQQTDSLEGLLSTVDVVAEEEVVGLGRETSVLEEPQQIVVLSVDITCKSERVRPKNPSA